MSYEETPTVLDARQAEGESVPGKSDCLQRYVEQLADSIRARSVAR